MAVSSEVKDLLIIGSPVIAYHSSCSLPKCPSLSLHVFGAVDWPIWRRIMRREGIQSSYRGGEYQSVFRQPWSSMLLFGKVGADGSCFAWKSVAHPYRDDIFSIFQNPSCQHYKRTSHFMHPHIQSQYSRTIRRDALLCSSRYYILNYSNNLND